MTKNIAIFASGEGSNAQHCIDYFKNSENIKIVLIASNNPSAKVLMRGVIANINTMHITKSNFYESVTFANSISELNIQMIVLAGFLWKMPNYFIRLYPHKIVNIHPSLLPKYGGKGMYGSNVHDAVIAAKETESGITIHYVNEEYDKGEIIVQQRCIVNADETTISLQNKIRTLEHTYLPMTIENLLTQ